MEHVRHSNADRGHLGLIQHKAIGKLMETEFCVFGEFAFDLIAKRWREKPLLGAFYAYDAHVFSLGGFQNFPYVDDGPFVAALRLSPAALFSAFLAFQNGIPDAGQERSEIDGKMITS